MLCLHVLLKLWPALSDVLLSAVRVFVYCRLIESDIVTMCILFVYINNNTFDADDYQLVIAMNREEFIDRPTLPAHFWNEHCISGQLVSFITALLSYYS